MGIALEEAKKAYNLGEVPIGAVLIDSDGLIACDHNLKETTKDPTGHAEIRVIRKASRKLNNWRLTGTSLYVTLEPCPMCAGAIINSRIDRVVFGAFDPKAGAAGTLINLLENKKFNHQVEIITGIMEEECKNLLSAFFKNVRK
jgi:tRNA(adenine34) deaminase